MGLAFKIETLLPFESHHRDARLRAEILSYIDGCQNEFWRDELTDIAGIAVDDLPANCPSRLPTEQLVAAKARIDEHVAAMQLQWVA